MRSNRPWKMSGGNLLTHCTVKCRTPIPGHADCFLPRDGLHMADDPSRYGILNLWFVTMRLGTYCMPTTGRMVRFLCVISRCWINSMLNGTANIRFWNARLVKMSFRSGCFGLVRIFLSN